MWIEMEFLSVLQRLFRLEISSPKFTLNLVDSFTDGILDGTSSLPRLMTRIWSVQTDWSNHAPQIHPKHHIMECTKLHYWNWDRKRDEWTFTWGLEYWNGSCWQRYRGFDQGQESSADKSYLLEDIASVLLGLLGFVLGGISSLHLRIAQGRLVLLLLLCCIKQLALGVGGLGPSVEVVLRCHFSQLSTPKSSKLQCVRAREAVRSICKQVLALSHKLVQILQMTTSTSSSCWL